MESKRTFDLLYPEDWVQVEPPEGVTAIVVSPVATDGFHANLVVTQSSFPADHPNGDGSAIIDRYLWEAIDALTSSLNEATIDAIWVTEPTDLPPQQRLIVRHLVDGIAVELAQHHTWCDDGITVISASMAINPDPALIALLDACLLSAAPSEHVDFVEWQPELPNPVAVWSPGPDAERIAHL